MADRGGEKGPPLRVSCRLLVKVACRPQAAPFVSGARWPSASLYDRHRMLPARTAAIFGLAILSSIFGQEASVRISGRVIDAKGSGVPNTRVIFASSDTKQPAGETH